MSNNGYLIITDPHQKKDGYYRIVKTTNPSLNVTQMNVHRARKDAEPIMFFPCVDITKAEALIKTALKNKFINSTSDWIQCPDENSLEKIKTLLKTLTEID